MHIACTHVDLLRVLALLKRAIKETTDLPILSHVLLEVEQGEARLSANNLEIGITCELVATGAVEGAVSVPWRRLADLVEHLPQGASAHRRRAGAASIEMETSEGSHALSVRSGRSRAVIYGMHASEFPTVPRPGPGAARDGLSLRLSSGLLAAMVHKVAFAAATSEKPNPILTGILLHASGSLLTISARDAHRLAACEAPLAAAVPRECAAVLRAGLAAECAHVLASVAPATPVQLVIEEQRVQVSFLLPGIVLSSRLDVGNYPMGFRQHVKPNYLTRVVVETKGLAAALKSLAQVAGDGGDLVTLTFSVSSDSKGVVAVGAQSQDLGGQTEEVDAVSLEGEAGDQLLLKYSQMAQVMAVLDAPYLALEKRGSTDPVAVRPVGGDASLQETYVLVPCVRKE